LVWASFSIQRLMTTKPLALTVIPTLKEQVRSLTDEELLALFPDTPVALATMKNGTKRLIFPRPGDEQRFIAQSAGGLRDDQGAGFGFP